MSKNRSTHKENVRRGRDVGEGWIARAAASFARDPSGLKKIVGLSGAVTSLLVGALNLVNLHWYYGYTVANALSDYYVWTLALFAFLFLITAYWRSRIAGGIHVAVLLIAAFLGARTSQPSDVTSAVFVILGVILLFEYQLGTAATIVGFVVAAVSYPIGLAIGYGRSSEAFGVNTGQALILIIDVVICFGAVFWRHMLRRRDEARLLEERVDQRTAELAAALEERSVMLQEIHHRVKNNLQMIASLLQMEARKIEEPALKNSTDTSIRRIHAMALVHETLYQSRPLHAIRLDEYVGKLTRHIQLAAADGTRVVLEGSKDIVTTPDFALPFGLIVNELVTNACRHAFPAGQGGTVAVHLEQGEQIELRVTDDGVGLGAGFDVTRDGGLGLTIVRSLARQLTGTIQIHTGNGAGGVGTSWVLLFPRRAVR
ncbi:sensor histidine kinase [Salinispira pacifica]